MEKLIGSDVFVGSMIVLAGAYIWLRMLYSHNGVRENMAVVFWIGWAIIFFGLEMQTLGIITMSFALLLLVIRFINWNRAQQEFVPPRLPVKNDDPDFTDPTLPQK